MNLTKKIIILLSFIFTISLTSNTTFACALCLDIFPEYIIFDSSVSNQLKSQNLNYFKDKTFLDIDSVSCTKQNLGSPKKYGETKCVIKTSVKKASNMTLIGEGAVAFYSTINHLTIEPDNIMEESDLRTGKRIKAAWVNQAVDESTVTIEPIRRGTLTCYLFKNKNRCEIEINELHGYITSK